MAYAAFAVTAVLLAGWIAIGLSVCLTAVLAAHGVDPLATFVVGLCGILAVLLKYVFAAKPLWLERLTWLLLPALYAALAGIAAWLWPQAVGRLLFFLMLGPYGIPVIVLAVLALANAAAALFMRSYPSRKTA